MDLTALKSMKLGGEILSLDRLAQSSARAKALPIGLNGIDNVLPEGGLPRGAVVEIAAPRGLARTTTLALRACASAQAEARLRGGEETAGAWCAWIDPSETLFAPGAARAGVDLTRLLVVRPPKEALSRVAVRVASSHAFSVVVVDLAGVPGCVLRVPLDRWAATVARRLALAIEASDTTIVLLTDLLALRAMQLPVAMRIELERPNADRLVLRVAKDRRGRVTSPASIPLTRSTA
jgi:recombination protein RecA